jgi:AraC-like DNA-binding protein
MKIIWESLTDVTEMTSRHLEVDAERFSGPLHTHDAIELTWIRSGRGMRFLGGSVEPFEEDDLVLIAPSVAHTWLSHERSTSRAQASVLQLRATAGLSALPEWQRDVAPLFHRPDAGWVITGELQETLRLAMRSIADLSSLARLSVCLDLLSRITHAVEAGAQTVRPIGLRSALQTGGDPAQQRRLLTLLGWIQRHHHSPISSHDAARRLHISPAAFSRAFKRLVGKPFSVYVNDLRIADACLALTQSDRPIADIALRSGFGTLSNFNSQFRSRLGLTPRDYRTRRGGA